MRQRRTPGQRRPSTTALGELAGALPSLTAVTLLAACAGPAPVETAPIPGVGTPGGAATVTHVVDGDTLDVTFDGGAEERVRLLGIDTPETVKPNAPVECFGPEASARAKAVLTPGTPVLVQRDTEARDRYGRLLVYLWRRADGLFVNADLVTGGFARTLSIEPNTAHQADLSAAAAAARAARSGLWGACGAEGETGKPGP